MATAPSDRALTRQGQDRRDELLEHAERLFLERGLARTRMVDIAEAAGVAKGLVYWYFESKHALLLAIVLDVRDRLRTTQIAATAGVADPLGRLYVGTVVSVSFVHEHWNLYRLISSELTDPRHVEALSESSRVHAADTVGVIRDGQADGTIRPEDPNVVAHANQGIVNQFALACQRGHVGDVDTAAHAAARVVVHSVAASAEIAAGVVARHGAPAPPGGATG